MKKSFCFCLLASAAVLMTGCADQFEPTESTIFVTAKGNVQSAVMESFDKTYYDFDELSRQITEEVREYCEEAGEDAVTVESLSEEAEVVTLQVNYRTPEDYTAFNDMILFAGTYEEAKAAGYLPENLYDTQGQEAEVSPEEAEKLNVIVTEESVCIQTSKKIRYVSDNVSIIDKKLAKAMEAGSTHPAFVLYK